MTCISDLGLAVCYVDGKVGIPKPSTNDHFEIENKPADEKIEMCGTMVNIRLFGECFVVLAVSLAGTAG